MKRARSSQRTLEARKAYQRYITELKEQNDEDNAFLAHVFDDSPCIHCGAYDGDHDAGCSYLE